MYTSAIFLLASFATLGKAHFQLQFPPPRGVFVEDKEPTFCDGYDNVANRTQFPLSNGFFTLNSEHPQWSSGVLLASSSNPTSFDNFSQINTFFTKQGEGVFCIPLDFSHSNATGLQDGQNVTLQIVFDGGDGALYQCADLTLSSTATIPSSIACNGTGSSSASASSGASTAAGPTSAAPPASSTPPASANNSARQTAAGVTGLSLSFLGIVTAMML